MGTIDATVNADERRVSMRRLFARRAKTRARASFPLIAATVLGSFLSADAGVTNFDDMPEGILSSYDGFNWTNVYVANGPLQGAGYAAGVVSPTNVGYNGFAQPAEFTSSNGAPFDVNGVYVTAAWRDMLQVTFTAYNGATLVGTQTVMPSATDKTYFPLNFTQVTRVTFASSGGTQHLGYAKDFAHAVLDDLSTSRVFTWQTPAAGSWTDGANWDLTVAPSFDDYAVFDVGSLNSGSVSLAGAATVRSLTANTGTVSVGLGGNAFAADSIVIGQSGGDNGSVTFQNGAVSSATALIGAAGGSVAKITTGSGTSWNNSGAVYIGGNASSAGGAGTLEAASGSSIVVGGTVKLWPFGTLALSGGSISAAQLILAGGKILCGGNLNLSAPLQVGGGELQCNGGTVSLSGAISFAAGAQLSKTGNGTLQISGAQSASVGAQLTISAGTLNLNSDAGGNLNLIANSTTLLNSSQHLASLTVANGATATAAAGGTRTILAGTVSVAGPSRLDLKDNKLITHTALGSWSGSAYTGVLGLVATGRNGNVAGLWAGSGIVTSMPSATSGNFTTLAAATASQVKGIALAATSVWAGQTVTGSDTLVMYTYGGDANLDGKINVDDYGRIDFNINLGTKGYFNGDFNYDGKINVDDYGIIDFNIAIQGPAFSAAGPSTFLPLNAVPEPAGVAAVLVIGGAVASVFHPRARRPRRTNLPRPASSLPARPRH